MDALNGPGALLPLAGIFASAFAVGFSGAIIPGPMTTVTITHSARYGVRAGVLIATGHAIVEGCLVLALLWGAAAFFTNARTSGVIAVAGSLVLAWMGCGMMRDRVAIGVKQAAVAAEAATVVATASAGATLPASHPKAVNRSGSSYSSPRWNLAPMWSGGLTSLSNPYWFIWWSTIGVGYLTLAQPWGAAGAAVFFIGHILADFVWFTLLALAVAGSKSVMSARAYQTIALALGAFLLFLACGFFRYGLEKLLKA